MIDMFIGFLSYTNEAVIENQDQDISLLDETVLDALDIRRVDRNECILTSPQDRAVILGEIGRGAEAEKAVLQSQPA